MTIFNRRYFLFKYLCTYMVIFLFFIVLMIPLERNVHETVKKYVINNTQSQLERGLDSFSALITNLREASAYISNNPNVRKLCNASTDILPIMSSDMLKTKELLCNLAIIQSDNILGRYLLFKNNPSFVSDFCIAFDFSEMFDMEHMQYGNWTSNNFRENLLETTNFITFLLQSDISINTSALVTKENVLSCAFHNETSNAIHPDVVCVFIMPTRQLIQMLLPDDLLHDSNFTLSDTQGKILISSGETISDGSIITLKVQDEKWKLAANAAISEDVVYSIVKSITLQIRLYIYIGLICMLIIGITYALTRYRSTQRVFAAGNRMLGGQLAYKNEYDYFVNTIEEIQNARNQSEQRIALLNNAYINELLLSACVCGLYTQKDRGLANQHLRRIISSNYRILLCKVGAQSQIDTITLLLEHEFGDSDRKSIIELFDNMGQILLIVDYAIYA